MIIENVKNYFNQVLGRDIDFSLWNKAQKLPFHLKDRYKMYCAEINSKEYLFIVDHRKEEPPGVIAKHIRLLESRYSHDIIYVREAISSVNRTRLIDQQISFIIPNNQMFLLPLGIDLREWFKQEINQRESLSPASQAILIYLIQNSEDRINTRMLIDHFGYSRMTVTRSIKELINFELISASGTPKRLTYAVEFNNEFKEKALSLMDSPVKKSEYVIPQSTKWPVCVAGYSALSEVTMITEPLNRTYALTGKYFNELVKSGDISLVPYADPQALELEIWSYDPFKLTDSQFVDNISLYLSLRDSTDDRTQIELDRLRESLLW